MYLPETARLFTQLWASLQSGEADGGAVRRMRTRIGLLAQPEFMRVLIRLIARK